MTPANATTEAIAPASAPTSPAPTNTTPSSSSVTDPNDPMSPAPSASESDTPGVNAGAVAVRGPLHPTRVQAAMRTAYPAIRECHRAALEKGTVEDKPVRVQLNFEITEQGAMTKLTDDTANLNPLVSSCILRAVLAVKFEPPKRGIVVVTYPIELTKP